MIWFFVVEYESSGPMSESYLIEEENGIEEIRFVSTFGAEITSRKWR
jgi:hypothetical protein